MGIKWNLIWGDARDMNETKRRSNGIYTPLPTKQALNEKRLEHGIALNFWGPSHGEYLILAGWDFWIVTGGTYKIYKSPCFQR